jgi:hypothetical protein
MIEKNSSKKICNHTDILQSANILQKTLKILPNLMKYYITYEFIISILYEELYSCDFTKKHLDEVFHSNKHKCMNTFFFLKKHYHLKDNRNFEEGFVSKIQFHYFSKH